MNYFYHLATKTLLIQEIFHGVFAIPFALYMWKKTGSWKYTLAVILLTYMIDFDHLIDYFYYYGFNHFNLLEFLTGVYFNYAHKSFILLHAWEWVIALAYLTKRYGLKTIFGVMLLSLIPHLIFDSITLRSVVPYSITYRILHGFSIYH